MFLLIQLNQMGALTSLSVWYCTCDIWGLAMAFMASQDVSS